MRHLWQYTAAKLVHWAATRTHDAVKRGALGPDADLDAAKAWRSETATRLADLAEHRQHARAGLTSPPRSTR